MKTIRSNKKVTPFGGAVPVLKQIKSFKIPQLIRKCLGTRPKQARYSYEDVIIAWMLTSLCGGLRLDHITKLKKSLNIIPNLKLPSHDTLGRVMKQMATGVLIENSISQVRKRPNEIGKDGVITKMINTTREINEHNPLNKLLVKTTCAIGLLKPNVKYDLDMDVTLIETEVRDAKLTYKKFKGFSPMVATINDMPVFVEMRNGNVSPRARLLECLQSCIRNLRENKIEIGRVTMDSAGVNSDVINWLNEENIKFCIGFGQNRQLLKRLEEHKRWTPTRIDTSWHVWDCESADMEYSLKPSPKDKYRLVILRVKRNGKNIPGWIQAHEYAYKIIITNDRTSSAKDLILIYNQRGTSEQNFSNLKNEFAWRLPPFSNMNENTVFLLIAALTNNVYLGLINKFKKHVKQIRTNARLKDFIFTFMSVACEILDDTYVFYNTDIAYEKIC